MIFINCNWVTVVIYVYIQNMKLVTTKLGREGHMRSLECWEPSQHLLLESGKPSKTCVEMAGLRTFRMVTSGQQSDI